MPQYKVQYMQAFVRVLCKALFKNRHEKNASMRFCENGILERITLDIKKKLIRYKLLLQYFKHMSYWNIITSVIK